MQQRDTDIANCPHCGNLTPQEFVGEAQKRYAFKYVATQCQTCFNVLLYRRDIDVLERERGEELSRFKLMWPSPGNLHSSVPKSIASIYDGAVRIKALNPDAFAGQIRRALEAVCKDRGVTEGVLANRLKELVKRGEIPPSLAEMTDVLREIGNLGSHADEESVKPEYVEVIDEFFRAVVEYVYIGPHKVAEFKKSLEQARNPVSAKPAATPAVDNDVPF